VTATVVAGTYQSGGPSSIQLNGPQDVYVDRNGNLYVTEINNHRVQKFIGGSLTGTTIAGITGSAGPALNQFNSPRYFTFDSTETNMYVVDANNDRVMSYSTSSTSGTNGILVAGVTGTAANGNTALNKPWGIHTLPSISTDLFIVNNIGYSVIRWTPLATSGTFVAGTPGTSGPTATTLQNPSGIKIDNYLNMYVADGDNHRIQMFCAGSQTGTTIAGTTGSPGSSAILLNGPRGIAFDAQLNMYIGDFSNKRVQKFLKL